MSSSKASGNGGLGLFGVLFLIAIVIKFIWWIVGAAVLVGLFFLGRAIAIWYSKRAAEYARYRDGLAARAHEQHNWVLQGDDRGIYGIEGAKLMHFVFPALDAVRRSGRGP